jgi:hypothetical protein
MNVCHSTLPTIGIRDAPPTRPTRSTRLHIGNHEPASCNSIASCSLVRCVGAIVRGSSAGGDDRGGIAFHTVKRQ